MALKNRYMKVDVSQIKGAIPVSRIQGGNNGSLGDHAELQFLEVAVELAQV